MDLARSSRYWTSYRSSKTFRLTIYLYEAHLGFSNNSYGPHGDLSGTKVKARVSLPNDPMGEQHETRRAKTPNPVWDQPVVLNDIGYSELVRIEILGARKLGENPVLASTEFEVHDVMGFSLRGDTSVFQLECDRSRARFGVITMAFRFDPPVAADFVGDFNGPCPMPRPITPSGHDCVVEDGNSVAPAWGALEQSQLVESETGEPVYMNVEGNFACLLLDDDLPIPNATSTMDRSPGTAPYATTSASSSSVDSSVNESSLASVLPGRPRSRATLKRPLGSHTSSSEQSVSDVSETIKFGRVIAARKGSTSGSKTGPRQRTGPLGSLAHQLSHLGHLGSGGAKGGQQTRSDRLTTVASDVRSGFDAARRGDDMPHRWSFTRLRLRQDGAGGGDGSGGGTSKAGPKQSRPRSWRGSFLRSPTLARAFAGAGSKIPRDKNSFDRETSTETANTSIRSSGFGADGVWSVTSSLRESLALDAEEVATFSAQDHRYDLDSINVATLDGASLFQP